MTKKPFWETKKLADAAKADIIAGKQKVFTGPLYDQSGAEKVPAGTTLTDKELLSMDWNILMWYSYSATFLRIGFDAKSRNDCSRCLNGDFSPEAISRNKKTGVINRILDFKSL